MARCNEAYAYGRSIRIHTFFLPFRDRLVETYDELYTGSGGSSDHGLLAGFGRKWGWYQSVHALAQGDVRRLKDITGMNVHTCMLALCFEKEKSEVESKQIKSKFK